MHLSTGTGTVVAAKRLVDFVQGGNPLTARLPIPKHDKTLTAYAAMGFCVSVCSFAEYLHVLNRPHGAIEFPPSWRQYFCLRKGEHSPFDALGPTFGARLSGALK
jgi:hypothetical protein